MLLHPWGCILDWSRCCGGCGEGGDAEHPPARQGLDPAPQQPRQPSQGLHPAPLGAAQRSQRESRSHFPRSPAWLAARCHLCPQCPVRKDRSCLNTPHRQTQGGYFVVPTISVADPSLLHQPHVSTETCPQPARVTTRVTHIPTARCPAAPGTHAPVPAGITLTWGCCAALPALPALGGSHSLSGRAAPAAR